MQISLSIGRLPFECCISLDVAMLLVGVIELYKYIMYMLY